MHCYHHGPQQSKGVEENKKDGGGQKQNLLEEVLEKQKQAKLIYYCESCEELCCEKCLRQGPHNNKLHKIDYFSNFHQKRMDELKKYILEDLTTKQRALLDQLNQIEDRVQQINYNCDCIEKDARVEFDNMIDRIIQSQGSKSSVLQQDISRLQRDIDAIEDLIHTYYNLTERKQMLSFLLFYQKIKAKLEQLVSTSFKTEINEYPYDIPRELADVKIRMQKVKTNEDLISYKNEIIWQLKIQIEKSIDEIKQIETEKQSRTLNEWIE